MPVVERNPTTPKRDIPTLWVSVRNARPVFQIDWTTDCSAWFEAGPLACHMYRLREWRLLLDGKLIGNRVYETAKAAMQAAQGFGAVRERLAR